VASERPCGQSDTKAVHSSLASLHPVCHMTLVPKGKVVTPKHHLLFSTLHCLLKNHGAWRLLGGITGGRTQNWKQGGGRLIALQEYMGWEGSGHRSFVGKGQGEGGAGGWREGWQEGWR
jgi:hypothetical protein